LLLWEAKIFKNCLKIVYKKSVAKSFKREFFYFPRLFSARQHQDLFTSEIFPLAFSILSQIFYNGKWENSIDLWFFLDFHFLYLFNFSIISFLAKRVWIWKFALHQHNEKNEKLIFFISKINLFCEFSIRG